MSVRPDLVGDAVIQVPVNDSLVRHARLHGQVFEILDGLRIQADAYRLFELRRVGVFSRLHRTEIVMLSGPDIG